MKPILSICVFQIGTEYLGIDLDKVTKVAGHINIQMEKTSDSPNIIGMAYIDNETMAVIDLNKILNMRSIDIQKNTLFLVIETEDRHVCFPVHNIVDYYEVDCNNLFPVPSVVQRNHSRYFTGITFFDDKLVLIVDPAIIHPKTPKNA